MDTLEMDAQRNVIKRTSSSDNVFENAKRQRCIDSKVGTEPEVNKFEMPSQIGERDLFSILNDDCIFSALSFLDWDTLDTMEQVSQKMYSLINHEGYRKQKKVVSRFEIKQFPGFHKLMVYGRTKGDRVNRECMPTSVSGDTCYTMQEFFNKYAPNIVEFTKIVIDNTFLDKLFSIFKSGKPNELIFHYVRLEDAPKLTEFVLKTKIRKFSIHGVEPSARAVFDKEFFHRFCSTDANDYELSIFPYRFNKAQTWTVSNDFLPTICRFSDLVLGALILTVDQLKKLIPLGFAKTTGFVNWAIQIDRMPKETDFAHFENLSIDYTEDEVTYYIKDGQQRRSCTIIVLRRIVDDYTVQIEYDVVYKGSCCHSTTV